MFGTHWLLEDIRQAKQNETPPQDFLPGMTYVCAKHS